MTKKSLACLGLLAVSAVLRPAIVRTQINPIVAAMQDELARSMAELRMKDAPAPYYIAYEVQDRVSLSVSGRLGALIDSPPRRMRLLRVEVRVGDYSFDSSRFIAGGGFGGFGGFSLNGETALAPLDDDYDAMRREIWITTDDAYKRAVNTYARKRAAFQNRNTTDLIPDFSKEPPSQTELPTIAVSAASAQTRDAETRAQQASAALAAFGDLQTSDVTVASMQGNRYFLNSEGFKAITPIQVATVSIYAETQADDGMVVRDTFSDAAKTVAELPAAQDLVARARNVGEKVTAARKAPLAEEFTGPVMLEGIAAPEFIAETLVPLMAARRAPDSDNPRMAQSFGSPTPFLSRTGLRVMADSFSATDTPSMTSFNGKPLAGSFVVDDEGVRARDVTLVDKGRLVTLLTSRTPQRNFPQSNGHARMGPSAAVFELESNQPIPLAEMKQKYLALLKAQDKTFGYIVRSVRSASNVSGAGPGIDEIVKVTLDGREEPVRGLEFADVVPTAFRDLSEASQERVVYNYRQGATAAVSVIAPSLIFEELELQRPRENIQKPPIVPHP